MEKKKLNGLQCGRGIAALMVVLYHANGGYGFGDRHFLGHIFTFGFAGVDFFFVLSGFIIAYSSIELIGKKGAIIYFLKKRFIRVYPIYWIYLFVGILFGIKYFINIHLFEYFWKTILLFPEHNCVIETSWTLPFEITFYLLFAFFIYSRWSLLVIIPVIVISLICTILSNFGHYELFKNHYLNDFFSPFNIEFLFGFLAFYLYKKIDKTWVYLLLSMILIIMILEILYFKKADFGLIFPGERVLPFGLLALTTVLSLAAIDNLKLFRLPNLLIGLGNASYTLYLIHANIFTFINENIFIKYHFSEDLVKKLMIVNVLFVIWLSFMLYKYIEKPLLIKIKRILN